MDEEFTKAQLAYGHEGYCVRAVKSEHDQIRLLLMHTDAKGKVSPLTVQAKHCIELTAGTSKPRQLFEFTRQSYEKKMRILGRAGFDDVMVSPPIEPVLGKKWKPEGVHIQIWMTLLEQVFPCLSCYNVNLLELILREKSEDEEEEEMRKKISKEVEVSVHLEGRHLLPIHCPESSEHPDGHWTLLSLETGGVASDIKVKYFETLNEPNEECLRRAKTLLDMLAVKAEVEISNCFRQCGDDCTWWVLHYCELEARLQHGETGGACFAIGNPLRKQQLKHLLKMASDQLEKQD